MGDDDGRDLLECFRRSGCPGLEGMDREELDWLWENENSVEFLKWLVDSVSAEKNVLTPEELSEWEKLKEDDKNSDQQLILHGDALDAALESLETGDNFEESIEELRDQLCVKEAAFDEMTRASKCLSEVAAKQTIKLGKLTELESNLVENELRKCQNSVSIASENYSLALEELDEETKTILDQLRPFSDREDHLLISELDSGPLKEADEKFNKLIDLFIEKQFISGLNREGTKNTSICYDLVCGRDASQFETLVMEIVRLKTSYEEAEKMRIISLAKLRGAEEALRFLENDSKDHFSNFDRDLVLKTSQQIETNNEQTQNDILGLFQTDLLPLLEKLASLKCEKIFAVDLQTKMYRQRYTLDRLGDLREILLEQRARQEVFAILYEQELKGLEDLRNNLEDLNGITQSNLSNLHKHKEGIQQMKNTISKPLTEKFVNPSMDPIMNAVGKMLTSKESSLSYASLEDLVQEFVRNLKERVKERETLQREITRNQSQVFSKLQSLQDALNIGRNKRGASLECEELRGILSKFESKLRSFEDEVKNSLREWESQRLKLKLDPKAQTEKKLWIEFLTNPKLMEININCIANKHTTK